VFPSVPTSHAVIAPYNMPRPLSFIVLLIYHSHSSQQLDSTQHNLSGRKSVVKINNSTNIHNMMKGAIDYVKQ
jgi:hypothetical protein